MYRKHLLYKYDGENWEDLYEYNHTACLKVYTVETVENDTNNTPTPQPKPVPPKPKAITQKQDTIKDTTTYNIITQRNLHTIRLANDDTVIYTGSALTLEALNRIFDLNFTNGHLLVYIDGVLVFNDTTTDDITLIILEIIDKYLGEHDIKVVFTDSQNQTKTYNENVIIG